MKRLHLLILRSFIGPFFLVFFIVLFVLLMQFLWRYIDELVGKGLEISVFAELLLYTAASLVPMALPLAILMSSLMTLGNMGEYYELTAIKASGISLQRIMMPLLVLVTFISIGAFFFANDVLPYSNLKMRSLLYDLRKQRPEILIIPGSFYNGMEGYSIRIDNRNPETKMMYEIKIYDHTGSHGNTCVIIADSGSMIVTADKRSLIFTLYNGYSYIELQSERESRHEKRYPHRFDRFAEQQMVIELVGFGLERTDENLFKSHYQMMNLSQLNLMEDSVEKEIGKEQKLLNNNLIKGSYFKKRSSNYSKNIRNRIPVDSLKTKRIENIKKPEVFESQKSNYKTAIPVPDTNKQNYRTVINKNLFDQLTLQEKDQVLETALINARNTRTLVVNSIQSDEYKIKLLRRYEIEWQRKFTIAFACFVFLLIGAPLGAIIRKGGLGLPLVISTLFFIFFYIISLLGEKIVRESILPAYQGMWLAPGIFFVIGIFLTYKATTDASILNFDTYSNFLKKYLTGKKENMMEVLEKENSSQKFERLKKDIILANLASILESIGNLRNIINFQTRLGGFFIPLIGLNKSDEIITFERLYKNLVRSIANSNLMDDPIIRVKLMDYPDFISNDYIIYEKKLSLRLIFLFIPPVTLVVIIRNYLRLQWLIKRLKTIYRYTEEMMWIIKNTEALK